ncbi:hypothetical protein D3C80_1722980 [compost metagenome]
MVTLATLLSYLVIPVFVVLKRSLEPPVQDKAPDVKVSGMVLLVPTLPGVMVLAYQEFITDSFSRLLYKVLSNCAAPKSHTSMV